MAGRHEDLQSSPVRRLPYGRFLRHGLALPRDGPLHLEQTHHNTFSGDDRLCRRRRCYCRADSERDRAANALFLVRGYHRDFGRDLSPRWVRRARKLLTENPAAVPDGLPSAHLVNHQLLMKHFHNAPEI